MSELNKFSLCRVHANCFCLLRDAHLSKQEEKTILKVKSHENCHLPEHRIYSMHVWHLFPSPRPLSHLTKEDQETVIIMTTGARSSIVDRVLTHYVSAMK